MPQLKIIDVKEQLEAFEKEVNEKFAALEARLDAIVSAGQRDGGTDGVTPHTHTQINDLNDLVKQVHENVKGHVEVYNKHIVQQHNK